MRNALRQAIVGMAGLAGGLALIGCADDDREEPSQVAISQPAPDVYYQPGYYYEREYYDVDHHWHPRRYYYYTGREWQPRESIPRGYEVRERPHGDSRSRDRDGDWDRDHR